MMVTDQLLGETRNFTPHLTPPRLPLLRGGFLIDFIMDSRFSRIAGSRKAGRGNDTGLLQQFHNDISIFRSYLCFGEPIYGFF